MTAPSALPPSCARRFRPVRVLAKGGFGTVWLAQQLSLDRPVAVKVLHGEVLADAVAVQRFLTEARVTSQLKHPNIVVLVDHDVEDGVPWIAYEYVEGESLREKLDGGPLPWREACRIAVQIAQALEAAHARGVLHRDIKPDNVLEAGDGLYKVADFGVARQAGAHGITATGQLVGTPGYLSPVQLRGEVPGPESDIYALGVTLFELATGVQPFQDETPARVMMQHLMVEPPRPSSKREGIPAELDRIVLRALAKDRAARYPTAAALRADLERVLAPAKRVRVRKPAPARGTAAALLVAAALAGAWYATRPAPLASPRSAPVVADAAPEPVVRLVDLHEWTSDDRALFLIQRQEPVRLILEARPLRWSGPTVTAEVPADTRRGRVWLTGLTPERDYTLDVHTPGGASVIDHLEFSTDPAALGQKARALKRLPLITRGAFVRDPVRDALDDRAAPLIAAAIEDPTLNDEQLADLALVVRDLRHPVLASRLMRRLKQIRLLMDRGTLVNCALTCHIPEAEELALGVLASNDRAARDAALNGLAAFASQPLARALIASLEEVPTLKGDTAGYCLAHLDPELSAAAAAEWLVRPDGARPDLRAAAIECLARVEPERARSVLAPLLTSADLRHVLAGASAAAGVGPLMRDLVAQAQARHPEQRLLAHVAAFLGLACAVPLLFDEIRSTKGSPLHATLALASISGEARNPALEAALSGKDPEVSGAAVWVIGHARIAALAGALSRVTPAQDPQGFALWARARLRDPAAGPVILERLHALAAEPAAGRRAQAARLLAVAAAKLKLADAIPYLRQLAPPVRAADRCVHAALDLLNGTGRARFLLLHGDLLALRTGIPMTAGGAWLIHAWQLSSDDTPKIFMLERHSGLVFFTQSANPPGDLTNTPHPLVPFAPTELVLSRTLGVDVLPDPSFPRVPAQVVVLE